MTYGICSRRNFVPPLKVKACLICFFNHTLPSNELLPLCLFRKRFFLFRKRFFLLTTFSQGISHHCLPMLITPICDGRDFEARGHAFSRFFKAFDASYVTLSI